MTTPDTSTTDTSRWQFGPLATYILLPLGVYILASIPAINALLHFLALASILALLALRFVPARPAWLAPVLWALLVLSLVGASGWFFSPFFFALYLLGIAVGFLYRPHVAIAYTGALVLLFFLSGAVGETSPTHDFFVLLSLLTIIPIILVLRRSFLLVQQDQKGILILEGDEPPRGVTSLHAILANRINTIGILLRQPLTYLKQGLALLERGRLTEDEEAEVVSRMRSSVDDLLTLEKEFERGTTTRAPSLRKSPAARKSAVTRPARP